MGQSGSRSHGRGGRRGGRGGNRKHLMVAEEEEVVEDLTEENQTLVEAYSQALRAGQKQTCYMKSVVDETSTSSSSRVTMLPSLIFLTQVQVLVIHLL
jgi:hypothetical protein